MKKTLLIAALLFSIASKSQSYEHRWNVGLHGGFTQYWGELGNGFYRFQKAFYGHGGVSVSRYLTPHLDATILGTRGVAGFLGNWNPDPTYPTRFLTNLTTVNLQLKYNFLNPESWFRPYVFAGVAGLRHEGVGDAFVDRGRKIDFAPEAGAGLNFHFGKYITLQLQEMFMYTSADDVDFHQGGLNDMYVFHTAGLTFNLPKLGKLGGPEKPGPRDDIDKCPKIKQHKNKVTKSEGQSLRKEKKSKRRAMRKSKKSKS